ncbi:MAG TPA: HEAT repeat domain-containing protein [Candidatus Acidoferrum sp.]
MRNQVQNAVRLALLATALAWGMAQHDTVHAQQPGTTAASPENAVQSSFPKLQNSKLQVQQLNGSLSDTVNRWAARTTKPEWLGYVVAEVQTKHSVGCWHGGNGAEGCGICRLEGENSGSNIVMKDSDKQTVKLEGPRELIILYRAESGKIGKIRMVSLENSLDAGGLTLVWLQGVHAPESVALLEQFVRSANVETGSPEKISQGALAAIAQHADPSADRAMESFVAPNEPASLRKETAFWIGEARGAAGLRVLQKMARGDQSPEVREQVAFALSISPESGALSELIRMAHDDQVPKVRGQALFWLGQKAGERASKAITGSIENDPDTYVKKKAVFALSQMPADQGVPKLIQVAQTNRNPVVRKEAMFWLGQSGDPQALVFFEKVLSQ